MPPPDVSKPGAEGPKKYNVAEAQDGHFKIAMVRMSEVLREERNKPFNEVCETQLSKIMKTIQIMKAEFNT